MTMPTSTHMPIIKAVLFDLDGTLLDTAQDMASALNQLRQRHGLNPLAFDRVRHTVSHGARALIKLAFGLDETDKNFEALRLAFLHIYSEQLVINTALFAGIECLLNELSQQHIAWGIVTNKPAAYTHPILKILGLFTRCQSVICPDDVINTKPHPEPLFKACEQIHCDPSQAVYIGDHARDIEAGNRAGMLTIATAYGYLSPEDNIELWNADFCVNHANEILPLLSARFSGI